MYRAPAESRHINVESTLKEKGFLRMEIFFIIECWRRVVL